MVKRGAFIVFEGVDRCGKTTQTKRLLENFRKSNIDAQLLRFPEREHTKTGKIINSYLQNNTDLDDHVIHLLFSANRWEYASKIEDLLKSGKTLIVDRYAFSGVSYTASKPGMDINWCKQPDVGLPKPDCVLYLDISVEEATKRGEFGEERYEKLDFQQRVAANFKKLSNEGDFWTFIDASKSVEEVEKDVKEKCFAVVQDVSKNTPDLERLWVE